MNGANRCGKRHTLGPGACMPAGGGGGRRKVAESMLAAQCPSLGRQWNQFCSMCTGRRARWIPAAIHRDFSRLHSALHDRFSFSSDKKGLYAM